MKINLLNDGGQIRTNALNIDPFADPSDEFRIFGGLENLDLHVDDGEAEEVIAYDIIDYFPQRDIERVIQGWVTKLKFNGRLTLGGWDVHEISKATINGVINLNQINEMLYEDNRHKVRKSTSTIQNVANMLQKMGLKVLHKRLNGFKYVVVAERV